MKKIVLLAVLCACAMLLLSGCSMYEGLIGDVETELQNQTEATEEPTVTVEPLTEPMYTDRAALYQYYNAIRVDDTLETLTEKYGEPTVEEREGGTNYEWKMEDGYGFCATFAEDGSLAAKVLYYDDLRQLGELSGATALSNVSMISDNYTLDVVKSMLGGRAMQIAAIVGGTAEAREIQYVYCWITSDGTGVVQVLFGADGMVDKATYSMPE